MHRPQLAASWQGAEALRAGSASSSSKLLDLRFAPLSGLFHLDSVLEPEFPRSESAAGRSGPAHSSWLPQHK